MVSHELRTPLNAILGWTQLMARSPGDLALLERGLDVVARNTRLQAQLVSDLLDISRIVEGKLTLDVRSLDVRQVVTEAIDTVAQEAAARGLVLRTEPRTGAAVRRRRSRAPAADRLEPVVQRDQVHPGPRRDCGHAARAPRARSRSPSPTRGAGIRAGGAAAHLRSLPPGRSIDHAAIRRSRAGPGDRQAPGGAARRPRPGRQRRRGHGLDLHRHAAGERGARAALRQGPLPSRPPTRSLPWPWTGCACWSSRTSPTRASS